MDSKMVVLIFGLGSIFFIPIFVYDVFPLMIKINKKIVGLIIKMGNVNKISRLTRRLKQIEFELDTENNSGNPSYWELVRERDELAKKINATGEFFVK